MPVKAKQINRLRGERVKSLLSEHGMTQKELAEKIGYVPEHLSFIVNGRRNLTEEAAHAISALFPGVRFEWLMGFDDFKTERDYHLAPIREPLMKTVDRHIIFTVLLHSLGYDVKILDNSDFPNLNIDNIDFENVLKMSQQLDRIYYLFSRDNTEIGRCSPFEYESLISDIFDYADFKIKKICERQDP